MEGGILSKNIFLPRAGWNVLPGPDPDDGGVRQGAGGVQDKVGRKRVPRKL